MEIITRYFLLSCKTWWQFVKFIKIDSIYLLYKVHDELILISGTFWGAIRDEIAAAEPPTGFQGMCTM